MSFFKEIGKGFKKVGQAIFGKDTSAENRAIGNEQQQAMFNALKSGQLEGRKRAEELYGTTAPEIGGMSKDVVRQTQKATQRYSGAGDLIKRQANQQAKIAKLRGGRTGTGTKAEQAQIGQTAATESSMNRFNQQQQAMNNYRSLVGNLARNMAMSEMGQGQLNLSAIRPLSEADMKQSQGLLSFLM